jgi:hypothetical protein
MTAEEVKDARTYAWSYFALHADQRMKLFNFFLLLSGLILGAFPPVRNMAPTSKLVGFFPAFLVLAAFIFWRLDERTRFLIKNAEAALKLLDKHWSIQLSDDKTPHFVRLFDRDEYLTADMKSKWWVKCLIPVSYTDNFRLVFLMVGCVGTFLAAWVWLS